MNTANDLRSAIRVFRRAPFVPLLVTGLTAVGLGLVLGMWAIVDAAFLRPLPLPDPDRIVVVFETHPQRGDMSVAARNFLDWSPQVKSFSALGGQQAVDVNLGTSGGAQRLSGVKVTPGYFDVWQVPALRGRTLTPADFAGDVRVVVLSARVWRQAFGASESLVGTTVRIDGEPHTVVGIMSPEASLVGQSDVWTPWVFSSTQLAERRFHEVGTFARLRAGVSAAEASAELSTAYARLAADHPDTTRDWSSKAVPLREVIVQAPKGSTQLLVSAVLATLVVAVLNIVGLLLGWWPRRRAELVTRRALGAGTGQLVRQLTLEGLVMLAAGAVAGVGLTRVFIRTFGAAVAPSTTWYAIEPALDLRMAAAGTTVLSVMVLAALVLPAWRIAKSTTDLAPRRAPAGAAASHAAIALQVGAAFVLLVTSASLLDSARRLGALATPTTSAPLAVEVSLSESHYPQEADQRAFFTRLLAAVRALPDVADVGAASYVPPTNALGNVRFDIDGRSDRSDTHTTAASAVDDRAFRLLGVRLLRGRLIDEGDTPRAAQSAVISDALARRYWSSGDPLGSTIRLVGVDRSYTIVGVVSDVRRPLSTDPRAETVMYFPYQQLPWPFMTLVVEPRGDVAAVVAGIRRELARIDPDQATGPVRALSALQSEWLVQPRLQGALVTLFGASTLLLTLAGLYARVAYAVAQRAKECAVRQAVGATPARVIWLLTSRIVAGAALGLALGAATLPALATTIAHMAFEVSITDGPRVLGVALAVGVAAAAACYLPARGVRTMNLAQVIRSE